MAMTLGQRQQADTIPATVLLHGVVESMNAGFVSLSPTLGVNKEWRWSPNLPSEVMCRNRVGRDGVGELRIF